MRSLFPCLLFLLTNQPPNAAAEVLETYAQDSYRVAAPAGSSLKNSLNRATPIRQNGELFHAYTRWHIDWRFWWNRFDNGRCEITRTTTQLRLTVTLPELGDASTSLRDEFERYRERLQFHESGHVRLARETAQAIDRAIRDLPPQRNCSELEAAANAAAYRLLEAGNQRNRDYDRQTGHGRQQGAWLP